MIGAIALVAAGAAVRLAPIGRDQNQFPDGGVDSSAPVLSLHGLAVASDPTPHILRALAADGRLLPGEQLMLRARLSRPAFLALLSQRPQGAAEPIWPATPELHPAGEFELEEGASPLLLNPVLFGSGVSLALLACPTPPRPDTLRTRNSISTPASLATLFPNCTADTLSVSLAPPPDGARAP